MLDEYARALIESAARPSQLDAAETRDLISSAYLRWLASYVFENEQQAEIDYQTILNRLSLASSLLREINEDAEKATAFLVAEASEIARYRSQIQANQLLAEAVIQRAIHYLDLATFFHLADYDANASVVARDAISLMASINGNHETSHSTAILSYYRCLGYFLSGEFGNCQTEGSIEVSGQSSEERAFLFLRSFLATLTRSYAGDDSDDQQSTERLAELRNALAAADNPYLDLSSEASKLSELQTAANEKSLYRLLAPFFPEETDYLLDRVSGADNQGFPFAWPPTREFITQYLLNGTRHAVISVPTGGGKSLLAELAAAHALRSGWVLYMAPTNALCAQIRTDLESGLSSLTNIGVEAFLGNLEYTSDLPQFEAPRVVLSITPEKALLLLKREPDRFKSCSLVVLDECHMLGSKNRGDIAEIVLAFALQQNPEIRVLLMSALVQDSEKLALWLEGVTGANAARITLPWRPTRTARLTVLPDWNSRELSETSQGTAREVVRVRAFADTVTPWEESTPVEHWLTPIEIERTGNGSFPWRNDVSRRLAEQLASKGLPTLIFVLHSRHHAFSIANNVSTEFSGRPEISQLEQDYFELARYELGAPSIVRDLVVEKGASVHIASMLSCEREASETAFRTGSSLLMTATGTLSQGLNLPAQAVVICGTKLAEFASESDQEPEELRRRSLNQVLNAAGRAARANIACRGLSIIVPDDLHSIEGLNTKSSKQSFLRSIESLALKDASLSVDSQLRELLEAVNNTTIESDISLQERALIAKFPVESESLALTVRSTLGLYELDDIHAAERITNRLETVKQNAVSAGVDEWLLRASSLAVMDYDLANRLRHFIIRQDQRDGFIEPSDSYVGWALFLIEWLQSLPAVATWELLKDHIRSWRYYWGSNKDPDLLAVLEAQSYPQLESESATNALEQIWENLADTVRLWLNDGTYLELAETLTRRSCPPSQRSSRTSAGHYIPRAIAWSRNVVELLSRYAGLLLAVQDQWQQSDPDSLPNWLADAETLQTFPLGIRYGVAAPSALAWHRYAIQERRAANLLDSLIPIGDGRLTSIQDAWPLVRDARETLLTGSFEDQETDILHILRRLISED